MFVACDLIYLGSMEVAQPTGDAFIGQAAQQMKDLELMSVSIVNFKASKSGITITDSSTGYVYNYYEIDYVSMPW